VCIYIQQAETGESYYIFEEEFYKVGIFLPGWEAEYVEIISIDDLVSDLIDRVSAIYHGCLKIMYGFLTTLQMRRNVTSELDH
jgi:hypothetical protein